MRLRTISPTPSAGSAFLVLVLATAASIAGCSGTNSPFLSVDFRPGGVPPDAAGPAPDDALPGDRDGSVATDDGTGFVDDGAPDAAVPDASDPGPADVPVACPEGGVRGIACGLNDRGVKPQNCTDGRWVDGGPCDDPDECRDGDLTADPCGLNGRGTIATTCTDGRWLQGTCDDPDECLDGATGVAACGPGGGGTVARTCIDGAWIADGDCRQPGRWRCQDNACVPVFGDPACGDGACDPHGGESKASCPADCDPGDAPGQGASCDDAYDCAFYAWPSRQPGYWECRGLLGRTCNAVKTTMYCGTDGWDWCYLDTAQLETPGSCPQDCTSMPGDCGIAVDCIFQEWPSP